MKTAAVYFYKESGERKEGSEKVRYKR